MNDRLHFVVPGEPVPKGRARARVVWSKKRGKMVPSHYTPEETEAYEKHVATCCQIAVNQSRWTWHPKKDRFALLVKVYRIHEGKGGDADNYLKAVSDAINKVAYADDRYVRHKSVWIAQDASRPRVEVQVVRFRMGEGGKAA